MYDKLPVEGLLLHVMSVKGGPGSQQQRGCREKQPEADLGLMYGCVFSQGAKGFIPGARSSPGWRKLLPGNVRHFYRNH